jgi:hypothetical protein
MNEFFNKKKESYKKQLSDMIKQEREKEKQCHDSRMEKDEEF